MRFIPPNVLKNNDIINNVQEIEYNTFLFSLSFSMKIIYLYNLIIIVISSL